MSHNIIFSHGRSGGNLLELRLNQLSGVRRLGEVFRNHGHLHRAIEEIIYPDTKYLDDVPMENIFDVFKMVERIEPDYIKHFTYRIHPIHFRFHPNINLMKFFDEFDNHIILYRETILNTLVSLYIAFDIRSWHYTNRNETPSYDKYQFILNRTNVVNYHNKLVNYYNKIVERFGYDNIFIVRYEDLISEDFNLNELCEFLNIEYKIDKRKTIPTIHINPNDDNYKRVINYNEVSDIRLEFDSDTKRFKELLK